MKIIQERIITLQNSVKFLELILGKFRDQKNQSPVDTIQERIKSYKQELQQYENMLA